MDEELRLDEIERDCLSCRECPLCEGRRHVVFGVGDEHAELMLVGEGPGEQEDLQGEPFVGPAGQLLDDMLELIDLRRDQIYICNIVKCRPPRNRDPLAQEQDACRHWLDAQIERVRPKMIVCLGRIAATGLISEDFRITRQHGQWFTVNGIQMTAIYHPSALLRDPTKRPETFADLRSIRAKARELTTLYH